MKKKSNGTARLGSEFSVFDARVLLGLDELGLRPVAQRHVAGGDRGGVRRIRREPEGDTGRYCTGCGVFARVRSSWYGTLVHTPVGLSAVHLPVRTRRYECLGCASSWSDDPSGVAAGGRKLTDAAVWWATAEVVMSSKSVLAKGRECLIADGHRLDGVKAVSVDEHVWRHTPKGNRYVTVIVDLTPRGDSRPARLLDMVEGRGEKAFATWLSQRSLGFRDDVRVLAMDAFVGYKRAAARQVSKAVEVLDPFHIVKLAGDKLTKIRCRLQREATGRRGLKTDPLYRCRRALPRTAGLRTDRQRARVDALLAIEANWPLKLAEGAYQRIIHCYREPNRSEGRDMMKELIESLAIKGSAPGRPEPATLGRTLKKRMTDVLAFFDWEHSANGPTEAINGRLETLRGIALGFRNLDNYITRSPLHTGGFRQTLHTKT